MDSNVHSIWNAVRDLTRIIISVYLYHLAKMPFDVIYREKKKKKTGL